MEVPLLFLSPVIKILSLEPAALLETYTYNITKPQDDKAREGN